MSTLAQLYKQYNSLTDQMAQLSQQIALEETRARTSVGVERREASTVFTRADGVQFVTGPYNGHRERNVYQYTGRRGALIARNIRLGESSLRLAIAKGAFDPINNWLSN